MKATRVLRPSTLTADKTYLVHVYGDEPHLHGLGQVVRGTPVAARAEVGS